MNVANRVDDTSERSRNGLLHGSNEERDVKVGAKRTTSTELDNIIFDVEDLLKRVTHITDADVANLRERLALKIVSAKQTLAAGGKQMTQSARDAAKATDDYVRKSPWKAVGIAALAGAAIGYAFSRR